MTFGNVLSQAQQTFKQLLGSAATCFSLWLQSKGLLILVDELAPFNLFPLDATK